MAEAEDKVSLGMILRGQERILNRIGDVEDQISILAAMVTGLDGKLARMDATVAALGVEERAGRSLTDRTRVRVAKLEARADAADDEAETAGDA